jgi:hypothetical protein
MVNICKYVGVLIDIKPEWQDHNEYRCQKLLKFTVIFYRLIRTLSDQFLRIICSAVVHPRIMYGIEVYANIAVKDIYI